MKNEIAPNPQIFISPYNESLISAHIESLHNQKEKRDFLTTLAKSCKNFDDAKVIFSLSIDESMAEFIALNDMFSYCESLKQAETIQSLAPWDDRIVEIKARINAKQSQQTQEQTQEAELNGKVQDQKGELEQNQYPQQYYDLLERYVDQYIKIIGTKYNFKPNLAACLYRLQDIRSELRQLRESYELPSPNQVMIHLQQIYEKRGGKPEQEQRQEWQTQIEVLEFLIEVYGPETPLGVVLEGVNRLASDWWPY